MHGNLNRYSTNTTRILALDLGKFNSVLCVYDPAKQEHRFESVQTLPQVMHDLLLKHQTNDPSQTLVVMETCDVAGWVHDIATALGMAVAVANPSHEAWRWTRVKRKTDKDDALKLAKLTVLGQLPVAHMPSPQQRQRRRPAAARLTGVGAPLRKTPDASWHCLLWQERSGDRKDEGYLTQRIIGHDIDACKDPPDLD